MNLQPCAQCGRLALDSKAVTISSEEYAALIAKANAFDQSVGRVQSFRSRSRSRIARDPELAKFLVEASGTMLLRDLRPAAIQRFGEERVPSRSAIQRFLEMVSERDRAAFKVL